jgi:hypothetical protein
MSFVANFTASIQSKKMSPECFHPEEEDNENEDSNSWCQSCYKKNNP